MPDVFKKVLQTRAEVLLTLMTESSRQCSTQEQGSGQHGKDESVGAAAALLLSAKGEEDGVSNGAMKFQTPLAEAS